MEQNAFANRTPVLETVALSKHFATTLALKQVSLKFYAGQITGLIGENGSGKSTLSSILAGVQSPTQGEMLYDGKPHKPSSMIEAQKLGIGMIVQEQGYVAGITIAQNIFLGAEGQFRKAGILSRRAMNHAAQQALANIGLDDIDPTMYIDQLNLQDRKLIEIARVMYTQPRVLVVDETTTALSQRGRDILYGIMNRMREQDKAVIFISHDLDELMAVCDTLTVLRDGNFIATLERGQFDASTIKKFMVGRDMGDKYYREDYGEAPGGEVVLEANNITTATGLLMNVSLKVHKGEILGVGGLSHCGMHELGKALYGEETLLLGEVVHMPTGRRITSAGEAMRLGMGYVSKDRDREALVLTASIRDNIASAGLDMINTGPFVFARKEKEYVQQQLEGLSIKCESMEQSVQYLSGGNKQKVVFGKWVGRGCDILILDCPTRGVDVGVKAAMYALIDDMRKAGKTIVMISEELAELIGMCDRLVILKDGRQSAEFSRSASLTEHQIIDSMI